MRKYGHSELAKEILKAFLVVGVVGGIVVTCAVLPGVAQIFQLFEARNARERYRVNRTLKRLEQQKLLMRKIKNGKEEFVVTEMGKHQLESYLLDDLRITPQKKWDEKWRVLMFDIPEKQKKARDAVSFTLNEVGMMTIQNSTFISPYPCKNEIDFVTNFYKVTEHVIYFETDNIECKDDLLAHFALKR